MMSKKILKLATALSLFSLSACSSLLYYPSDKKFFKPEQVSLTAEDIFFKDSLGDTIHAWWLPALPQDPDGNPQKPKGTFVYFHGNAENLSSHFLAMSWLPKIGYNYLIMDYPGYGQSSGKPTPESTVRAAIATIQWVHDHKDSTPLWIYGQSLGGAVAMRAALELKDKVPMKIVIADGTFDSYTGIARMKLSEHWLTWLLQPMAYVLLSDRWAPQDLKQLSPIPLLVMHGKQDPIIPYRAGEKVFADAADPKAFISVPEGHHGDLFWVEDGKYRQIFWDQAASLTK
jgi:fermentation-respiration switch protein FrsA (DUF1100 family)